MKKKIIIGGTLEEAAERFVDTWHRAERGEKVKQQDTVTFISWATLSKVMTDKRHAMLKHLRRRPEPSVRALATSLKRDYKNVYEDVKALTALGLISESGKKLSADYKEIRTTIRF